MTQSPNRSDLLNDIDSILGGPPHSEIAVLVVDVATPNQYDDLVHRLGHDAAVSFGEAAVRAIGLYLPADTRLYSLSAARFGCVLKAGARQEFEEILDKLAYGIRHPKPGKAFIPVATTIGIGAAFHPRDGADAAGLIRAAVIATRESLERGTLWCPYDAEFDRISSRAIGLMRDIIPAFAAKDQLRLVYQPKTDLATGRCIGAEALMRWNHPTIGPIPPDEFVSLLERTSLVNAMTEWALNEALARIALWRAAGLDPQISINVSMRDLCDDRFAARLAGLLERHAVQPDWVDIEVTESALMKEPVRVGRQLDEIRRLGVAIEIDDYGSGQSGLAYLKYIPASYVKIDQNFVSKLASDERDQIIVRSTINLAHDLGLRVIAEGIRDEAALEWLRRHGCDIGQGNLLSPPLEAADFERLLKERSLLPAR